MFMLPPFGQARPSLGFPESGELLLLVEFPLEPVEEGEAEEEDEEEEGEEEEEEEEESDVADERPEEDDPHGSDQDQPESDEEDEGLDEPEEDPATPAVLEPCGTHSELKTAAALRPSLSPDVAWWW